MSSQARSYRSARGNPIPPLDQQTGPAKGRAGLRQCAHPGCQEPGEHRAPKDRTLTEYLWFCLAHVQEYNRSWNFYAGMNESEIEEEIRQSTVWDRPTWRMGDRVSGLRSSNPDDLDDPLGMFEEEIRAQARRRTRERMEAEARRRANRGRHGGDGHEDSLRARDDALKIMELELPLTRDALKARYKALVKRWHPDANGGSKEAEERFKEIAAAYRLLMQDLEA
ncbi:MAG: J domain-containing protein [Rhodospirillaceae bacterium]